MNSCFYANTRPFLNVLVFLIGVSTLAGADQAIAESYEIPVVVLGFYPDEDGNGLLDRDIVGPETGDQPASLIKEKTANLTDKLVELLESGSTFHGYRDPDAAASLDYKIIDVIRYDYPIPQSSEFPPFADHIKVLNGINICEYVEDKGVKEVWIWMYHTDVVAPIESNMSGPWGDISNSFRQDDLPHCAKTYTVFNYNYGRELSEATENHMHQIEAVLNYVDGRDTTPTDEWGSLLFWGNFVGSDITHRIIKPGCGWAHYPPNGETDYDWTNPNFVESDCEDWNPDGTGETQVFNCEKWNCDSATFFRWWMQNIPGHGNDLYFDNEKLKNWWSFIGDFDVAMALGKSLVWPSEAPVVLNPSNGHYYQLVENSGGIDWYKARDAAASSVFNGRIGHLATLTSPEEDQFVVDTFAQIFPNYVWLGATDEKQENDWLWITGEPWGYTKWDKGEPNGGEGENCLDYSDSSVNWNDESCDRKINFYLVEYDAPVAVGIDIKPGNKRNVINPRKTGSIWVAILSDTDPDSPFDPSSQVDIPTVQFGPNGAEAIRYKVKDVNRDGLSDLLLRFRVPETGIACGDTEATLIGETFGGQSFTGTDSIKTVGCKHMKHHKKKHHKKHHDGDRDDDKKHHGKHNEKKHHKNHHDYDHDEGHKKR